MKFIVLITVLLLVQYLGAGSAGWRDSGFARWVALCDRLGGPAAWRWALRVLPWPLLVAALLAGLGDTAWGLPAGVLMALVLLYSVGRGDLTARIEDYLAAWQRGDWQAAWHRAGDLVADEAVQVSDDPQQLHQFACRAINYQGLERLFAVVFWFMLLGPAAALAYRLAWLAARQPDERELAVRLLHLLEWVPARLLALSYALVGNFSTTLAALELRWLDPEQGSGRLLEEAASAALQWPSHGLPAEADADQIEAWCQQTAADLRGLQALQARSVLVWLFVIAVWQLL